MAGLAGSKALRVTWVDRLQARMSGPGHRRLALRADPAWAVFGHEARGAALLSGQFGLGEPVAQPGALIWDIQCDAPWRERGRQSFRWLDDLAAHARPEAQRTACRWVRDWIRRYGTGQGPGWQLEIAAERLDRLVRYLTWLNSGSEGLALPMLERVVARHQRFVLRRLRQLPGGANGLRTCAQLVTAGACLAHSERLQMKAQAALEPLCRDVIDAAGGIASRNPEALADIFVALAMAARALELSGQTPAPGHAAALTRVAPVVRGLRLGTGGLARFQGGSAGCAATLDAALSVVPAGKAGATSLPLGYARLARGRSIVVADVRQPPLGVAGADLHAGTLGFEMSSGKRRVIVNCGSGAAFGGAWHAAARQSASHSTVIVDGQSSCPLDQTDRAMRAAAAQAEDVEVELHDETPDIHVVAAHNGYAARYGLIHVRRLDLDVSGGVLRGEDLLSAVTEVEKRLFMAAGSGRGVPFALRFHLHPDVRAQVGGDQVHLALPSGERWCFGFEGALSLRLDASVYLDNTRAEPRASRQIVLEGRAHDFATTIRWRLEKEADMPAFLRENPRDGLLDDPAPARPERTKTMTDRAPLRSALISVSDKTGVVDFATALNARGVRLLSTGGTAKALRDAGLEVTDVAEVTGFPEMMDGRVKTLHPRVHGGLLALRDNDAHLEAMESHGIDAIDLLVVNLYPFEATVAAGAGYDDCIENIDIGGPAMIRAAAKNHAFVSVVVDPEDYGAVLSELEANDGETTFGFRQKLAQTAYARTAAYDAAVSTWMAAALGEAAPRRRAFAGTLAQSLRYGENPHQAAAFYTDGTSRPGVATAQQHQGKALSYNNINDTDAAFELVAEFDPAEGPACAIIKHANPCGVARGATLAEAYGRAFDCDRTSAFGGIIALNQPIDGPTAEAITEIFTEVVIAPAADDAAMSIFAKKKNLRLLTTGGLPDVDAKALAYRQVAGGMLVQDKDTGRVSLDDLKVVTKRAPSAAELADMLFAWRVAKHVKSNAIIYVKDGATVGVGAGQMSRVDSTRIAARKSQDMAEAMGLEAPLTRGSVVASDAFFPFADGLITAAEAGATAIIQPGGSMRDKEVIAAADEAGLAMVFTGMRHFRH